MARLITASRLRGHSEVQIHGICRSPDKLNASTLSNPNVKVFEAASTDTTALRYAIAGTSACICCDLGDNILMINGQKHLIDACIAEGAPRCIASDGSLDFRKLGFGDHLAKDLMKHIQIYLDEMEKAKKIKAVHILNAAFMEVVWAPFSALSVQKKGVSAISALATSCLI